MKTIAELKLGFSDAQNYSQRGNKQLFSNIFVKNSYLDDLLDSNIYFLIGEKGTGKTAYATYLSNNEYQGKKSVLKFISGTDYEKFYELKKKKQIDISGYVDIWKTIMLLLLAKNITENDKVVSVFSKNQLEPLLCAIDDYYNKAFAPEIVNALKIADQSEVVAKLICQYAEIGGSAQHTTEFTEQQFQMNLYYIAEQFSQVLGTLKLTRDITLFIDGIDIRPAHIPYNEYLECIKGLATACWNLNTELFANVRDSKGHLRVVLLLRPDIFNSLSLQNATNKLADNSVFLEWRTTYIDYPDSSLYEMANRLLSYDQKADNVEIWEAYFPWKIPAPCDVDRNYDTAFMEFLKISLSRPRDVQRILKILQDLMKRKRLGGKTTFDYETYLSNQFQNQYSEYFLSSLKDQLSFYYTEEDYKYFTRFFDFFDDSQFSFEEYQTAYEKYIDYILDTAKDIPHFVEDPKEFLQMLYDSNVITAIETMGKRKYFHFSYREKSATNICPEVPYEKGVEYRFHYGLYKKANFGRY